MEEHRADRLLGRADWLTYFAALAGPGRAVEVMTAMLDTGVAEPAEAIETIFKQTGVPYTRNGNDLTLAVTAI
jgi:hypothetical protein